MRLAPLTLPWASVTAAGMEQKTHLDAFGVTSLVGFALLLAFNQVVIAVGGDGWQPVFMAALRSVGSAAVLFVWMQYRGIAWRIDRSLWPVALLMGVIFASEFILLFNALDLTTVSRASVIFYSMPFWAALGAHFLLGERITRGKILGLIASFVGMAWAITDGAISGGNLIGDLCAMGASILWAAILIVVKGSRAKDLQAEVQLFWQVFLSIPILLTASLFFGPLVRDLQPIHYAALAFQIFAVASFGFLFWFWLLKIYPATSVASFSFLSPILSVGLGVLLLGEAAGPGLLGALMLVTLGLILVNRRQVPQKV